MSPLAFIPLGLYALAATFDGEIDTGNKTNAAQDPEQNVSLTKSIPDLENITGYEPTRPNTNALATTGGLADPIVRAAIAKALKMEVEQNKQGLMQSASSEKLPKSVEESPGQHFPKTAADDDGGYSAPLGLKDESHNDWMK